MAIVKDMLGLAYTQLCQLASGIETVQRLSIPSAVVVSDTYLVVIQVSVYARHIASRVAVRPSTEAGESTVS